jgi:cytochrome b subunit of formate dehydrogenase
MDPSQGTIAASAASRRRRLRAVLLFSIAAVVPLLALVAVATAAPTDEDCALCHGSAEAKAADGRSMFVSPEGFRDSTHSPLGCVACHSDVTDIPHADKLRPVAMETCAVCHADAVKEYDDGIHSGRDDGAAVATCNDCHGEIHAIRSHSDPTSVAHWSNLVKQCAHCHANRELADKYDIPIVQPVEAYLGGVHGRAVAAGERAAVCSDCHGSHGVLPSVDPRSKTWRINVPSTCGTCHKDITKQYQQSAHGVAVAKGVSDAPVCTDCHGEHQILAPNDVDSPVFARNLPSQTCGTCHADTRMSAKYGLPTASVSAFEDSFHGLALRAGKMDVANCTSCHGVHNILASSDPRSLVSPANLPATCGKCHPGAGTRFEIGPVHVSAKTSPTRIEYWIRLVYLFLIVAVVGFMVIHNAVDLIVKARHWPPPQPLQPVEVPERMSRALRWQHGLVMISFPVLVYTGFALTYPESWWAMPLLRFESNLGLRGLLHRAAAIVLLVAVGAHVMQLLLNAELRKCLRGLLPSWNDVRHFGARLSYYAGRRKAPHSGTFSYIEKLEYWAFMWGMCIMTFSGLPLWFSDASLRYLPKVVTDLATALHFYEAVLATLAILIWHLYWVIFDPDVYPMDWSWWNGKPPASRVLERQEEGGDPEQRPD